MFLGLDLGTSEVKGLLLDERGTVVGTATAPLTVTRAHALWSEQEPHAWWDATEQLILKLRDQHPNAFAQVGAIGLSGQMHGAVVLGSDDQVLRPAILWNDGRSHAECQQLTDRAPQLHKLVGNLAMAGFTAPKLLWLQTHEPEIFKRIRTVLLPKDWLRLQLCGEKVSEPSDAAGTLWLNVQTRTWSDELLSACDLSRDHMPRLVESPEVSGVLRPELAKAWGLKNRVVIAGGAGDNAASAIGIGAIQPGQGFISLGTSGVLFVVNDSYRARPERAIHTFCHAMPDRWHQMSVMLSAASCLKWWAKLTGSDELTLLNEVQNLDAASVKKAPIFLPYLAGERTPHNNPFASSMFYGLTHETDRALTSYAVLEGVAFGLADGLAAMQSTGTSVSQLSLVGGGSRSRLWSQLIADVLNVEIQTHSGGEVGGALGAARLAWIAAGGEAASVCSRPPISATFYPKQGTQQLVYPRLARFRELYRQTQALPSLLN